jgi:hypothetical protein
MRKHLLKRISFALSDGTITMLILSGLSGCSANGDLPTPQSQLSASDQMITKAYPKVLSPDTDANPGWGVFDDD